MPTPDAGPPLPRIELTAQIAKTRDNGYADPMTVFGPLDPPPRVWLGPIDEEPLPTAVYDWATGTVDYPVEFIGKLWRLRYQLGGATEREVHWSPPGATGQAPGGHLVEPLLGRAERLAVPTKSGYRITPIGSPTQHTSSRVFTTGLWTEAVFSGTFAGATFDYEYSTRAVSLSGPLGAPENQRFDHVLFADFASLSGCRYASGAAMFVAPDLVANAFTPPQPQPQWDPADRQVTLHLLGPTSVEGRLASLLGARLTTNANKLQMAYGYVPSIAIFGFSKPASSLEFQLPGRTCSRSPAAR